MKKVIIFCIIIIILLVVIFETSMRLCYGPPEEEPETRFFSTSYVDIYKKFFVKDYQRGIYIPNNILGESFSVHKNNDTIRVFIIGGSVAMLFSKEILETCLNEFFPSRNFEVINCGMGGYDSYRVYLVEREILNYNPDLIIIFSGNNEYFDPVKINLRLYYLNKFLRRMQIYRKLQAKFKKCYKKKGKVKNLRSQEERIKGYGKYLKLMVKAAKEKDIPIILCTLPVNLKDYPPNVGRPIDKIFFKARFLLENENYYEAIINLKDFLKNNPDNPLALYFLGKAYEGLRDYKKAKDNFIKALNSPKDSQWDNANSISNNVVRRISIEETVGLADLNKAFEEENNHGLVGRELLYDSCHWYKEHYPLVSKIIIKEIFRNKKIFFHLFEKKPCNLNFPDASCGFTDSRWQYEKKSKIRFIVWLLTVGQFSDSYAIYEIAISSLETLHMTDPELLWRLQFRKNEIKQRIIDEDCPRTTTIDKFKSKFEKNWPRVLYHIGETYRRLKLYQKSLTYFNKAIEEGNSRYFWPYLGKALLYHAMGDREKTSKNINIAEDLTNSLEVKYYKEILGF